MQTVMWRRDINFDNKSDYGQHSATTYNTSKSVPWESVFGETNDLHSPDLNPCDFHLWGILKDLQY